MKAIGFSLQVLTYIVGVTGCALDLPTAAQAHRPLLMTSDLVEKNYIIVADGNEVPADLAAAVTAAGGLITQSLDVLGIVVAKSHDAAFGESIARVKGVRGVAEDLIVPWTDPAPSAQSAGEEYAVDQTAHEYGGHETFRVTQWAPDAVGAPTAWAVGARGAGARVAIVDGGVYDIHPDIAAGLDGPRSASFVPGQPYNTDVGSFWHGTHVAGIVGARANGFGTVGIAPEATLIGVKVLHGGTGAFSWLIGGIVYAATPINRGGAGAHIINLSLGAGLRRSGPELALLFHAVDRAVMYARRQGVLAVAAAGNSSVDLDHSANVYFLPAQSTEVIGVSATGPVGFGLGATDFDRPASYSNYGLRAIDFAGPGGQFLPPGTASCSLPLEPPGSGSVTFPCSVFDMVAAPCRGTEAPPTFSTCWAAATSMAAPVVSGVAALIVGKYGPLPPTRIEARLRDSADDLGKVGHDDFYGAGRVNALRAVQQP